MIEKTRGGGSLGPGVVLWGMEDIGGRILWFMGEVSWWPGGDGCLFVVFCIGNGVSSYILCF